MENALTNDIQSIALNKVNHKGLHMHMYMCIITRCALPVIAAQHKMATERLGGNHKFLKTRYKCLCYAPSLDTL